MAKLNHFVGSFTDDSSASNFINVREWPHQQGLLYYDSVLDLMKMWDGTKWTSIGGDRESSIMRANCLSSDSVGNCVYINSSALDEVYQVTTANPLSTNALPVIGVIISKVDATTCIIQKRGLVSGIFSGLTEIGKPYYLARGGGVENPPPLPNAGELIYSQQIGIAAANDILEVSLGTRLFGRRG